MCSEDGGSEEGELPEDKGMKAASFSKFLLVCLSSTSAEENHPDYDIAARIRRERAERMRRGLSQKEADALIPALFFLTTNTKESPMTFDDFFRV